MRVVLLPHVKENNLDSNGNLLPGNYNVSYSGIMSAAPLFCDWNGETWGDGEACTFVEESTLTEADNNLNANIMLVYVKVK